MISLEKVWPEWKIEKQIGRGTFGIVYQAVRQHSSLTNRAAIKVISIPQDPYELETLRFDGLDMCDSRTYIESIVNDYVNEIRLLESFKGIQNIVSIEDYKVIEKIDEIGWDIYIRMELLKPLNVYICDKKMTEQEVIQLGCDICTALEICGQRNIIHRDIKPENIFVNDFGSFKLGDFGTARTMESMICDLSQKGTYSYMAPEVMNGGDYDARVDIYSLGLVLYRLMNRNRMPFISDKQLLSPNERRAAMERRLQGEPLPAPCEASRALADVILQACAFNREERFSSAAELRQALLAISNSSDLLSNVINPVVTADRMLSVTQEMQTLVENSGYEDKEYYFKKKKGKIFKILAAVLPLILFIIVGVMVILNENHIQEIVIKKRPGKLSYKVGDTVQTDGLSLEIVYRNGRCETIQDGFTYFPTELMKAGRQDITVVYKNRSIIFSVEVAEELQCKDLEVFCGSWNSEETGEGLNSSGFPVNWVIWIELDLTEEERRNCSPMIFCSWDHVRNGEGYWEAAENFDSAKKGSTYCEFAITSAEESFNGHERYAFMLFLPDNPSIAGEQSVTLQLGYAKKTIYFTLIYDGDYETGTGWKIVDVRY